MSSSRVPATVLLLAIGAACAGVSPRPEQADATQLPVVTLDAEGVATRDRLVEEAKEAVIRRRYDEADALASEALDLDPRAARAHAVAAMVKLARAGRQDPPDLYGSNAGEQQVALAVQLAPGDGFVGWMQAVFLAEAGHMSAAAEAAEAALARCRELPANERAALLGIAGTYRYELGEERAALPHLQAYLALRPDDATFQFRLGDSLLRRAAVPQGIPPTSWRQAQRDAEAAARAFRRCAQLVPGDEDAAIAVGTALLRAAALADERVKKGSSSDDKAASERDANRAAAEEQFKAVAERFPTSPLALAELAHALDGRGERDAARAVFAAALVRDGKHVASLLGIARLEADAGERPAAVARMRRLLELDAAGQAGLSDTERDRIRKWLAAAAPAEPTVPGQQP
jgi:tetratricopeptide (TPR) repeat protein